MHIPCGLTHSRWPICCEAKLPAHMSSGFVEFAFALLSMHSPVYQLLTYGDTLVPLHEPWSYTLSISLALALTERTQRYGETN